MIYKQTHILIGSDGQTSLQKTQSGNKRLVEMTHGEGRALSFKSDIHE